MSEQIRDVEGADFRTRRFFLAKEKPTTKQRTAILATVIREECVDPGRYEEVERYKLDVTGAILKQLFASDVRELEDSRDGAEHVLSLSGGSPSGPFSVELVDSVCDYFGVKNVEDITDDMHAAAGIEYDSSPKFEFEVEVERIISSGVRMKVRARSGGEALARAQKWASVESNYHEFENDTVKTSFKTSLV